VNSVVRSIGVFIAISCFSLSKAGAQPTSLDACLTDRTVVPVCNEVRRGGISVIDCRKGYDTFRGRVALPPLTAVGPVTVEINAFRSFQTTLPIWVEIVPLAGDPTGSHLCEKPGFVVMQVLGSNECSPWESHVVDITQFVNVGDPYSIQFLFLDTEEPAENPGIDCIRVIPIANNTTPVMEHTWSSMKVLFQ